MHNNEKLSLFRKGKPTNVGLTDVSGFNTPMSKIDDDLFNNYIYEDEVGDVIGNVKYYIRTRVLIIYSTVISMENTVTDIGEGASDWRKVRVKK